MRIFNKEDVEKVNQISGDFSFAHGQPIHTGDPMEIGINKIQTPDWGDCPRKINDEENYSNYNYNFCVNLKCSRRFRRRAYFKKK